MSIETEALRIINAKADIKTAIEEKGVTVGDGRIDTYAEKIREISGGGSDENNYNYATTVKFDEDVLPPKVVLNLDNITSLNEMFGNVPSLEEVTINSKSANIQSVTRMFYKIYYRKLRKITIGFDTSKITGYAYAFSYIVTTENGVGIVEIIGTLDVSSAITLDSMFLGSSGLKEVRFTNGCIKLNLSFASCQFLSDESIQSIIDGLADLTGATTQTITFHADVGGRLTDEQKTTITAKNWTLAY